MPGAGSSEPSLVLIVEDEAPIADVLAEIVADAGYRTLVAENGRAGLALARAEHPALIITDLMMPLLDGAGLIATLHADADADGLPAAPIIVMTAAGRAQTRRVWADAILAKPFAIDDVERLLHAFLDRGNILSDAATT
jgi:CheY-like chemotaxis protein